MAPAATTIGACPPRPASTNASGSAAIAVAAGSARREAGEVLPAISSA
jgi:hypothetical protein